MVRRISEPSSAVSMGIRHGIECPSEPLNHCRRRLSSSSTWCWLSSRTPPGLGLTACNAAVRLTNGRHGDRAQSTACTTHPGPLVGRQRRLLQESAQTCQNEMKVKHDHLNRQARVGAPRGSRDCVVQLWTWDATNCCCSSSRRANSSAMASGMVRAGVRGTRRGTERRRCAAEIDLANAQQSSIRAPRNHMAKNRVACGPAR